MKSVDIINVAGLLMDGGKDGLEQELREKVEPRFLRTIAPTPISSAMEPPAYAIERAMLMILEAVRDIERQFEEPNILLVGRSYGAFTALLAAIRMNFKKISKAILIEGPLHPDVSVAPPNLLPPLMACSGHYKARPAFAREAVDRLSELGTSRLVVVQGGREDSVVPTAAQVLPGDFETVEFLDDQFVDIHPENGGRGLIIKLPSHMGGRDGGMKNLLPYGYRNHLFWSEEKMKIVGEIINNAAFPNISSKLGE